MTARQKARKNRPLYRTVKTRSGYRIKYRYGRSIRSHNRRDYKGKREF